MTLDIRPAVGPLGLNGTVLCHESPERSWKIVGKDQALPMILNMPVPHSGHVPFMALRPFAIVTSAAFFMLRLALHFTQ